ncbi:UNVERIFIED_CONTAM: hypothetical protein GTU68_018754 [Idotea baltica]|nr:hypothetical protein [Idotea baltica]
MMVESEAYELTEAEMLGAVNFAHQQIQPVIDLIIDLAEDCAKEPFDFQPADYSDLFKAVKKAGEKAMRKAFAITDKQERTTAVSDARAAIKDALSEEQLAATDFPYTVRLVSEITESNGSSSMASVCGGSLSMMDAGVPLKAPVAGVAMGLILEDGGDYAILTDILGDEDHLGDMDFKVAGTENGITSLQMDIKVAGITPEIMETALAQAKDGRLHILEEMNKALSTTSDFSVHAPRIETMQVPTDKIREVIGSGGKVIREIVEVSGAKVDINDDGVIKIASPNGDSIQKAYDMIHSIVAEPEEGAIYTGTVVKIVDFGAFVNFFGKRDGLVHVSQIENRRLNHPSDVLKEGQSVKVKLLGFDDRGKVRLSMKVVDQETGEEVAPEAKKDDG